MVVPMNDATTSEAMLGNSSTATMRHAGSPARIAAAMKSLRRSDSVSARKTRAHQAQPANTSTSAANAPRSARPTTARRSRRSASHQPLRMDTGPRIEPDIGDVDEKIGRQHRECDEEEQALHERVVLVAHRLHEQIAEAGIG